MLDSETTRRQYVISEDSLRVLLGFLDPSQLATFGHVFDTVWGGFTVFRLSHNNKIFDPVIKSISVDMMNNLCSGQFPSKMEFHDMTMFKDSVSIDGYFEISVMDNSSDSVRVNFSEEGITETHKPLIVHDAKSMPLIGSGTTLNGTSESSFPFSHSESSRITSIPVIPDSLEVHGTHAPTTGWSNTTFYRAISMLQDIPPYQYVDSSYYEIATTVKRNQGKQWMNSGELPPHNSEDNPERSQWYTIGTCNDYWRGLVPLITS